MYTVKLSQQHLQVIATALANGPYSQVAEVIEELKKQISIQDMQKLPVGPTGIK
jgi:hypothetical protein